MDAFRCLARFFSTGIFALFSLPIVRDPVQVHPLLKELREAGLVEHVDALASLARDTAGDVRKLQTSVLDEDNVQVSLGSLAT